MLAVFAVVQILIEDDQVAPASRGSCLRSAAHRMTSMATSLSISGGIPDSHFVSMRRGGYKRSLKKNSGRASQPETPASVPGRAPGF